METRIFRGVLPASLTPISGMGRSVLAFYHAPAKTTAGQAVYERHFQLKDRLTNPQPDHIDRQHAHFRACCDALATEPTT